MHKDYEHWHKVKSKINSSEKRPLFKEREIWWCHLGVNVGDEQDGKGSGYLRPVLIIKKFNRNFFMGVPLSTQIKEKPYYHLFNFNGKAQSAILSQTKPIDSKRLHNKMGRINNDEFDAIKEKIKSYVF